MLQISNPANPVTRKRNGRMVQQGKVDFARISIGQLLQFCSIANNGWRNPDLFYPLAATVQQTLERWFVNAGREEDENFGAFLRRKRRQCLEAITDIVKSGDPLFPMFQAIL
jgi:hypothetical protein